MVLYFITALIFLITPFASAETSWDSKDFKLEYRVLIGQAVCWQTCRHSDCEESEYQIFYDAKTYGELAAAKKAGLVWFKEPGKTCTSDEPISIVPEAMPALQKSNPTAAARIVEQQGTSVKILISSDLKSELDRFINEKLVPKPL